MYKYIFNILTTNDNTDNTNTMGNDNTDSLIGVKNKYRKYIRSNL